MAKTPRMDAYLRLIYRLYEALYLLDILGRVRGLHHVETLDFSTLLAMRRRFLRNMAFLCDYKKGGASSAAVAVEDRKDCNVFWIASNEGPPEGVGTFLKSVIMAAKAFFTMPADQKPEAALDLTNKCVDFASSRIKKQAHGLSSSARRCREYITAHMVDQRDLGEWLRQFEYSNYQNLTSICQKAYEARKDPEMDLMFKLSGEFHNGEAIVPITIAPVFRKVRHIIGRLAAHIRTVKEVIKDSHHLEDLLDVFEVALVRRPPCVPRLQADGHTNLSGVLKRMLKAQDTRFPKLLNYLSRLDEQTNLEQELQDRFDPGKSAPCVHAEIQLLHHFYENNRVFYADDDFIATSKPACFCCKLYFRHHPASYVEPDSHEKIYANWGPICLALQGRQGRDDPTWIEHRRVMNSVINDIGREVINEIERRRRAPFYHEHPDTLTGLTASMDTLGDDSSDSQSETWNEGNEFESERDSDSEGGVEL